MDSSAPSLSAQCETPLAHGQREQMFSHKAQMGKADKHQRSAEEERRGTVKNPHSRERLPLPRLLPALSPHCFAKPRSHIQITLFVRLDVDN